MKTKEPYLVVLLNHLPEVLDHRLKSFRSCFEDLWVLLNHVTYHRWLEANPGPATRGGSIIGITMMARVGL